MLLLGILSSGDIPTANYVAHTLAVEAGGSIVFGLVLSAVLYYMLKSIDSYQESVINASRRHGGYALASFIGIYQNRDGDDGLNGR